MPRSFQSMVVCIRQRSVEAYSSRAWIGWGEGNGDEICPVQDGWHEVLESGPEEEHGERA
jgi:hypothetical protein